MKTVIVYYSMSGNCALIADKLAEALGADTLRIAPQKAYPDHGASKFLRGGASAIKKDEPPLMPYEFDASKYERVVFGMPIWASRVTPPLRTFVAKERDALKGKRFAAFACSSGGGADKAIRHLAELLGDVSFDAEGSFIDPKARPSAANDEKLAAFIEALK